MEELTEERRSRDGREVEERRRRGGGETEERWSRAAANQASAWGARPRPSLWEQVRAPTPEAWASCLGATGPHTLPHSSSSAAVTASITPAGGSWSIETLSSSSEQSNTWSLQRSTWRQVLSPGDRCCPLETGVVPWRQVLSPGGKRTLFMTSD
ncbi:hypothetical protein EYF80_063617 [Liparis tanakae]|uniref:Uncharacterized protein n=1 Tax=Liparis tanakae TaxID=230148 RepID=A0A4Z2EBI5_9TELE|nr:hypothetical protein EYF80_063617 [Liparis tanakae]